MPKRLIYAEDAIDALKAMALPLHLDSACEDIWERDRTLDNAIDVMRGLPSAQPETHDKRTETHACDLISRQAAIDALGEKPLVWDDFSDFDLGKATQWSDDVDAIKALPSAKPQRIKGKWDARGWNNAYLKCSNCDELTVFPFDFCPFCGSDMRGDDDE